MEAYTWDGLQIIIINTVMEAYYLEWSASYYYKYLDGSIYTWIGVQIIIINTVMEAYNLGWSANYYCK